MKRSNLKRTGFKRPAERTGPKMKRSAFITTPKRMSAEDKVEYEAVLERASPNGYPQCERCNHNGSRYELQMAHKGGKDLPKSRKARTKRKWMQLICSKCHSHGDHHGALPYVEWG